LDALRSANDEPSYFEKRKLENAADAMSAGQESLRAARNSLNAAQQKYQASLAEWNGRVNPSCTDGLTYRDCGCTRGAGLKSIKRREVQWAADRLQEAQRNFEKEQAKLNQKNKQFNEEQESFNKEQAQKNTARLMKQKDSVRQFERLQKELQADRESLATLKNKHANMTAPSTSTASRSSAPPPATFGTEPQRRWLDYDDTIPKKRLEP
jgi:DNA repair exonuclease SbcCD ATPase subunit